MIQRICGEILAYEYFNEWFDGKEIIHEHAYFLFAGLMIMILMLMPDLCGIALNNSMLMFQF